MQLSRVNGWLLKPWVKPLLWLVCALPMVALFVAAAMNQLGANPAEKLVKETGEWTLRWLWLTLAISPLREVASLPSLLRYRRSLGVTAFVYAAVHFAAYAWLDKGLVVDDIIKDVLKRNFIFVGVVALVFMLPLAMTSFNAAIRAMGGRAWQQLHKLVYLVAMLGLLHFYWKKSAKNDTTEVMVYALILALLLGWRVMRKGGFKALWQVR